MNRDPVVAIAGVTGAVGAEFIATLNKRGFPVGKLKALASRRSAGKTVGFRGQTIEIEELREDSFDGVDIALFSAGSHVSRKFTPIAVKAGAVVIDNSSAFRMDPNVPLVVPEINGRRIREHKGVIAVPNCSAITALMPLWPIHRQNRIKRMIISTYQAASGAGAAAMAELVESTRANLAGESFTPKVLPHPYAFNVFNHDTPIDPETGYNEEETKVINESRKILEDDAIAIGVTCVRVPVLRAHSQAITFECERPISESEVRRVLTNAPGVKIVDDRVRNYFPMPIEASGQDDVLVGRIRKDLSDPSGRSISLFVSADQLLKGAALNAVQIAELLPERVTA
ncbi:aspartate-semialdehyde dehydrogenase [Bradyrhizobium sp.]|uniref:aspartate-semialdehyde dehydrogenase n=1 Tax=Bradyrhizobium sp. TaxID=376 RepID=UPI00261823C2|nr:aspartate-semialdehyde dehydrogenase [Bradyrhizobium sp.]